MIIYRYVNMTIISICGGRDDEVQVGPLERGRPDEALPEMGDEVHDPAGAGLEEGDGGLGLVDREAHEVQRRPGG
jgi:hypothetical protein